MTESTALLTQHTETYRGFESLTLRKSTYGFATVDRDRAFRCLGNVLSQSWGAHVILPVSEDTDWLFQENFFSRLINIGCV